SERLDYVGSDCWRELQGHANNNITSINHPTWDWVSLSTPIYQRWSLLPLYVRSVIYNITFSFVLYSC
ncbi:hypothetical protein TMatcc_008369, partial [Talaromyces marneffei ATCC 18224]